MKILDKVFFVLKHSFLFIETKGNFQKPIEYDYNPYFY